LDAKRARRRPKRENSISQLHHYTASESLLLPSKVNVSAMITSDICAFRSRIVDEILEALAHYYLRVHLDVTFIVIFFFFLSLAVID